MKEKERLFTLIITLVLTVFHFAVGNDFLGGLLLVISGGHLAIFLLGNDKIKSSLMIQGLTALVGLVAALLNSDTLLLYLVVLAFILSCIGIATHLWMKKRKDSLDEKE